MSIRVLIVDDSSFVRDVLREVLAPFDDICVVGEARDGNEAHAQIANLEPDVVTMDILMPMMSGLEAVESIMNSRPTPILVVADAQSPDELRRVSISAGAVAVFAKPRGGFDSVSSAALGDAIRQAALTTPRRPTPPPSSPREIKLSQIRVLGIVSSTGGPQTLAEFLRHLPKGLPFPICLVQHTTVGFTETLSKWLRYSCSMPVVLAREGAVLRPGEITVAADDRHLEIAANGTVHLSEKPPLGSLRPAGDILLSSLAKGFACGSAGLICTGMGRDGSEGLAKIHQAGGLCIIQDPSTAILESMPKNAHKRVPSCHKVSLKSLAQRLSELVS